MRSFMFASALFLCVVVLGVTGEYCLHYTTDTTNVYNITRNNLPAYDEDNRNYTMNTCDYSQCGGVNYYCQICQWGSFCLAYSYSGVYSALPAADFPNQKGYTMTFYGDSVHCEDGLSRDTIVYVLCGQQKTELLYKGEPRQCEYYFELHTTDTCNFTPPPPTLQKTSQTASTLSLYISPDPVMYNIWQLTRTYQVYLNGVPAYHGSLSSITMNLPYPQPANYDINAVGQYGPQVGNSYKYVSGNSSTLSVPRIDGQPDKQDIINAGVAALQGQVADLAEMNQQLQVDFNDMNTKLGTVLLNQKAQSDLTTILSKATAEIDGETEAIQKQLSTVSDKVGSSSSGGGGGWVALGMFLGLLLGVALTVIIAKFALKVEFFPGRSSGYSSKGYNNSLVGDD